jgi:hypothetical protein
VKKDIHLLDPRGVLSLETKISLLSKLKSKSCTLKMNDFTITQYFSDWILFPATCFGLIGPSSGSDKNTSRVIELLIMLFSHFAKVAYFMWKKKYARKGYKYGEKEI